MGKYHWDLTTEKPLILAGTFTDSGEWMDSLITAGRDFVMCQEVGHTFGFDHQDEDFSNPNLGTCMDYTNDPGGIDDLLDNLHPNLHDFETLASIYEHVNSSSTDDGEGGSGNGRKPKKSTGEGDYSPEGPSDWGQAISQDAQGRNNVFERTLSNGQVLITHVLWAI